MSIDSPVIALVGPTAVGKTSHSFLIAERFDCEIVSVDSMQVYRYMDIGTAKATSEEQQRVRHYLIDIVTPDQEYHAGRFVEDATAAIHEIRQKGRVPLLVGGTGLYLARLMDGLCQLPTFDPTIRQELLARAETAGLEALYEEFRQIDSVMAAKIHQNDKQRIVRGLEIFYNTGEKWSLHLAKQDGSTSILRNALVLGLHCERQELYQRIDRRSHTMMEQGLKEEVQKLCGMGYTPDLKSMQSIGYRHMLMHLAGQWTWQETIDFIARDTRRYAKRQLTWFRAIKDLQWIAADQSQNICTAVERYLT